MKRVVKAWVCVSASGNLYGVSWYATKLYESLPLRPCTITYDDGKPKPRRGGKGRK